MKIMEAIGTGGAWILISLFIILAPLSILLALITLGACVLDELHSGKGNIDWFEVIVGVVGCVFLIGLLGILIGMAGSIIGGGG